MKKERYRQHRQICTYERDKGLAHHPCHRKVFYEECIGPHMDHIALCVRHAQNIPVGIVEPSHPQC